MRILAVAKKILKQGLPHGENKLGQTNSVKNALCYS